MTASQTPAATPRRFWLQFRLGSLIVVMMLCSLGVTWWRQWQLATELELANQNLKRQLSHLELAKAIHDVHRSIDLKNADHLALFLRMKDHDPWSFSSLVRQNFVVGGNQHELILFENLSDAVPGENHVLAVLLQNDRIVDYVALTMPAELDYVSGSNVEESKPDGTLQLVVRCIRRFSQPFVLTYAISEQGFGPEVKQWVQSQ
jgi:hypothetical protein